jgi:hypothetical protein
MKSGSFISLWVVNEENGMYGVRLCAANGWRWGAESVGGAFVYPQLLNALQKLSKLKVTVVTKPLIEAASRLGAVKPERSCHGFIKGQSSRDKGEFDRWWRWQWRSAQ